LHDKSGTSFSQTGPAPDPYSVDRTITFQNGRSLRQRSATIGGMSYTDTQQFIKYSASPVGTTAGTVDMKAYLQWLNDHGYGINMTVQ
jgi:hypothetical protein